VSLRPPEPVRRIAYLGTPSLAVPTLRAVVEAGYEVPLVVSMPERRRGRGGRTSPSPVAAAAAELGLRVADDLDALDPSVIDLAVVVAYGRIVPTTLLDRLAFVNLHFSLLPRWRGAAPVERAILAGDETTGVCVMDLEEGLDTGGIYRSIETPIGPDETLDEVRGRLVGLGTSQLLDALAAGFGSPEPQRGEPSHAAKITAEDREIDWSEPACVTHRRVRVGGAFTTWRGRRLKIHRAALDDREGEGIAVPAGTETLVLLEVQAEGKPRIDARAWANGARWNPGDRLGS